MGDYIGRRVNKEVKGVGTVKSYNSGTGVFEIVYDAGDSEALNLSQLICLLNGLPLHNQQQLISTSTDGRKPPKRQRIEIQKVQEDEDKNNSGNNAVAVEMNYENSSELNLNSRKGGGNLNNGLNLDLNYDVTVNLNDDDVDLNRSQGLNLDLNEGVDLNIEENVDANEDKLEYLEGSLNRSNVIDLNVDANGDVGHVLEDFGIKNSFDLNLGLDEVSKNIDVGGDEMSKKITCCFGEGGIGEKEGSRDTEVIDGRDKQKVPLNLETCLTANKSANGTLQEVEVQWTTPDKGTGGLEVQNGVVESLPKGKRGRKKRKVLDSGKGVTEMVLRRSARRARIDSFSVEDHVSCAVVSDAASDPLLSPAVSVVSEEKIVVSGHEESEKCDALPPKMDLPPSSSSLDLDGIPVLDVFSVYSFLRSFSTLLFLSPFELEDFVACIKANAPTLLFDSIHFSLLQILRKHLEILSDESSESASGCLRSLNWDLLDLITWPVFMVEYLLLHGSELKPSFDLCHLKLFERDYYKQPASLKIEMLRCLCDDVIEAEAIQSELNRRILAVETTNFERNLKFDSSKKRRASMDVASGSCLGEEAVNESTDWNSDECCLCKMDGSLICCDGCPAAFHSKCVGVASSHLPEGDWYCPECLIDKKKPWLNLAKSIRGAEFLATDLYGRLYYSCCDYLLVSDPCEDELAPKYYHRNDLALVIGMMKSSEQVYGTVLSAIRKLRDTNCVDAGAKSDLDTQLKNMPSNLPTAQREVKVNEGKQAEKLSSCSDDVGYDESETVDPSMKTGNILPGSDGSAEISQVVVDNQRYKEGGTFEDSNLTAKIMETRRPLKERKGNGSVDLGPSTTSSKGIMSEEHCAESYVNLYNFARMASLVVEELTKKSPSKSGKDATKTVEEIISVQLKAICSKSIEFCWPNIQNMKMDARKENCGWCFSCKVPECEKDCLFVQNSMVPAPACFSGDALGVHSRKNRESHLVDVLCYILSTEDRLHGLLSGPWLNPSHSQSWRQDVLKADDIATLRGLLLTVRDLDAHIRWNDIENTNIFAIIDKEFQKVVRSFKKVIVRRKSSEGSVVKYLLDFGKRRFLPDIVVRCGTIPEEASNERKRYWLEESHMPLHLVKGFEEKRIARISSKITVGKHLETKRIIKRSPKEKGFTYLFLKAERLKYYQCRHCNKDVLIRKSTGVVAAELKYTCHKCVDVNNVRKNVKRGRIALQKSKKVSNALRPLNSKVKSRGTKNKQPAQLQSSKKEPVVIPLRRSARRAKFLVVQNKKVGRKKGKQTKTGRGRGRPRKQAKVDMSEKNKPAEVAWKRKRKQLCRIYWLNVTLFRSKNLLVLSEELAAAADQPKCGLCDELEYTPTSNYISCEVCGDWFHGDAFNLTAERITKLIGFKCHKCRQRTPPFCAHLHTTRSKGKQVVLESTECKSAVETCDIVSPSSKGPLEQKSHLNDESGSCFTCDSDEKCPQGTLPDSCCVENGSLPIISSEQRETIDSSSKMDIVLPDEPGLFNDYVNHIKEDNQRAVE
ncbi:unnamed protein product [Withania somnifera]